MYNEKRHILTAHYYAHGMPVVQLLDRLASLKSHGLLECY